MEPVYFSMCYKIWVFFSPTVTVLNFKLFFKSSSSHESCVKINMAAFHKPSQRDMHRMREWHVCTHTHTAGCFCSTYIYINLKNLCINALFMEHQNKCIYFCQSVRKLKSSAIEQLMWVAASMAETELNKLVSVSHYFPNRDTYKILVCLCELIL